MSTQVAIVFWTVVAVRFLLPLLIPRYPLPAIIGCLVVDGVDQSVFQTFGFDPPGYQGYDKAMDVYYLAVAYLATMRNWTRGSATVLATFLFFYRMTGVVAFELGHWRPLLLIFPNTFEYFFIAYETIRARWDPRRFDTRFWVLTAAAVWIVVKLPQEYWIHIAQLDLTDTIRNVGWFGPALVAALLALAGVAWFVVRPGLVPPSWPLRIAADPLPEVVDTAAERDAWTATNGRVWSPATLEKVGLVGLIAVIYGQVLPGLRVSSLQLFVGIAVYVVVNAAISLAGARRSMSREGAAAAFGVRLVINTGLVLVARTLLGGGAMPVVDTLFFVMLLSLLTALHDRYAPVDATRRQLDVTGPPPTVPA